MHSQYRESGKLGESLTCMGEVSRMYCPAMVVVEMVGSAKRGIKLAVYTILQKSMSCVQHTMYMGSSFTQIYVEEINSVIGCLC